MILLFCKDLGVTISFHMYTLDIDFPTIFAHHDVTSRQIVG